jgi:outer membrane protein assembly factor BamB
MILAAPTSINSGLFMTRLAAFAVSLLAASTLAAADWPQFRGPNRNGITSEKGLLAKWPDGGPKLAWKYTKAGLGFSSFAIRDGKLYTLGTKGDDEIVLALDADKGGEALWTAKIGPLFTFKGNVWGDGPRSTPTLDGDLLFALGGDGDLVCVNLAKNGAEVWRKNLSKDFDGSMMSEWGYSESPLVDGDHVIVTPGGKKGLMVALDKKTGKLVWSSAAVTHSAPYSSAVAADINGARQYVQLSYIEGTGSFVNGIAAKDGKLLWQATLSKSGSTYLAPTPVVAGNLVYVTYGESGNAGCRLYEIGDGFKVKELYAPAIQNKGMKNTLGSVVLIDGHIYGHSLAIGWVCQELKSGKIVWNDKNQLETKSAATLAAGDMLYLFTQDGDVGLVKASPKKFDLVGAFKLPQLSEYTKSRPTSSSSKVWNPPAIANGKLYLRDCELIFCYEIK